MRVGVDIGGTKTDGVVLDSAGAVLHSLRLATGTGDDAVVATATRALTQLAELAGVPAASFDSIGIGIPGAVDAEHGIVRHARNLRVRELDLAARVRHELGVTVRVENDVNAAALGAFHQLGLATESSMAYLNLGTGLAAGLVLGGRLWRGSRGAAGEIGHILIDPAGPRDEDGQPGALEAVASGSGITAQRLAGEPEEVISTRLADGVASAVRVLVLTLDVDTVVIGGGVSTLGAELIDPVLEVIADWSSTSPFIASLDLAARIRLLPGDRPTAAIGAAWLGATSRGATLPGAMSSG